MVIVKSQTAIAALPRNALYLDSSFISGGAPVRGYRIALAHCRDVLGIVHASRRRLMKIRSSMFQGISVARVLGAAIFVLVILSLSCKGGTSPTLGSPSPQPPAPVASGPAQTTYAPIVDHVAPAVVTIRSERRVRAPQQFPFLDDPFFRDFFGQRGMPQQPRQQLERGLGSGVIVSNDGYILTNHHVVDGAEQITVDMIDKRSYKAKLVGSDQLSDLAVLKIDESNLPTLVLGNSDQVNVGDVVLAVGNPLGIGQTVTMGIISAKGRATGLSDGSFEDFLQTDAAINRGNSGGALVNTSAQLIGINSQILSPSGGNIGIGFAIPANMAKNVMEQLIKNGKVTRGKLGVTIQAVTSDLAASLGLKDVGGALVNGIEPGGPADRAGMRRGDVIIALNGQPIPDSNTLRNRIASTTPGTEVTLTVLRDGKEQNFKATLGELTVANARGDNDGGGDSPSDTGTLGMAVQPLTPDLAARLQLPSGTEGVVVTGVDPSGPASEAGVQEGDVVIEVNRQPVKTPADLAAAVQKNGQRPALMLVNRRGNNFYATIRPQG
jgi:serine protease Do